jgi:hypothetical protein
MEYELSKDELKVIKQAINNQYLLQKKGSKYYYIYKYLNIKLRNMIEMMEELESANT